ncbi:MAG: hypothetical protein Q9160_002419 [Pyrenula sp. 1 TL-2023]
MAAYTQHVVVSTGQSDWTSRIEDDGAGSGWGQLVRKLKQKLGRGGEFANPYNNVLVTTSSFEGEPAASDTSNASALIWPGPRYLKNIAVTDVNVRKLIQAELLPTKLHPTQEHSFTATGKINMVRNEAIATDLQAAGQYWHSPIVLICGHGGRDARCGTIGPLLQDEFRRLGEDSKTGDALPISLRSVSQTGDVEKLSVGLISHIGGHRFAGNVIIYFPTGFRPDGESLHPLEGEGIWYGRVEPKHVEGILESTLRRGQVIKELFRGGVGKDGKILRL